MPNGSKTAQSWESVSCCDDCWWDTDLGFGFMPSGLRMPVRMSQQMRKLEFCHFCGYTSFSGIYRRIDTIERPAASLRVREEAQ